MSQTPLPTDSDLVAYRMRVIIAVGCPHCGVPARRGCHKPASFMLRRSTLALRYVHDARAAVYDATRRERSGAEPHTERA